MTTNADQATNLDQATLLGHPVGLFVLFATERGERSSYYGLRARLIV